MTDIEVRLTDQQLPGLLWRRDHSRNTCQIFPLLHHLNAHLCFSPQDTQVQFSKSSLFKSDFLIWRLRSLLLWTTNNTLLFLTEGLCRHQHYLCSRARSREWLQLGVPQHECLTHRAPAYSHDSVDNHTSLMSCFWQTVWWEQASSPNEKPFSSQHLAA